MESVHQNITTKERGSFVEVHTELAERKSPASPSRQLSSGTTGKSYTVMARPTANVLHPSIHPSITN
jgi:hypothetical protein